MKCPQRSDKLARNQELQGPCELPSYGKISLVQEGFECDREVPGICRLGHLEDKTVDRTIISGLADIAGGGENAETRHRR